MTKSLLAGDPRSFCAEICSSRCASVGDIDAKEMVARSSVASACMMRMDVCLLTSILARGRRLAIDVSSLFARR